MDEVFITFGGERHYLWRAVDQDGDLLDILLQKHGNRRAAKRFFLFRLCRHGLRAMHYRIFREQAFATWRDVACVKSLAYAR